MALFLFFLFFSDAAWSYRKISIEEIQSLDWNINGTDQELSKLDRTDKKVYLRDLNWILENKKKLKLDVLRSQKGKKAICYFNLGRLQADPFAVGEAQKIRNKKERALALEKALEKRNAAYEGIYRHYRTFDKSDLCYQKGDPWNEPWISWSGQENKRKALQAYKRILEEASTECDAIDFDNTDVFDYFTDGQCGSRKDGIEMLKNVCSITHDLGMSCLLKNSDNIVDEVSSVFDISLMEQCFTLLKSAAWDISRNFKGKPVICVEYKNADVEKQNHYIGNFKKDCELAKKNGISYFFVETDQSVQGNPYPGMECRISDKKLKAAPSQDSKANHIDAK